MTIPFEQKTERQKLDDGDTEVINTNVSPSKLIYSTFNNSHNGFGKYIFDSKVPYATKRRNFTIEERGYYFSTRFDVINSQNFDINDPILNDMEDTSKLYGFVEYLRHPNLELMYDVVRYIGRHHYHVDSCTKLSPNVSKYFKLKNPYNGQIEKIVEMAYTNTSWLGAKDISFYLMESGIGYIEDIVSVTTLTSTNPLFNDPKSPNEAIPSVITIIKSPLLLNIPEVILERYLQHPDENVLNRMIPSDLLDHLPGLKEYSQLNMEKLNQFKKGQPLMLINQDGKWENSNQDEGEEWYDSLDSMEDLKNAINEII
ncbi:hypothetical protein BN7_6739 [Wickerhamomyces ciferrii]|uniref:Uncharacterized protein n=1 Tax=Wickerhamomyces ciferrii (strain ATCC 14091 / BCRC 22168 / CBS 111 / JCM 3599 / NBRC 0793 / NRRL Y-1031 F-60-10) TaxID=1206466 RepID=K0L0Z7_WICCF|nr:uncharacterized protein BN7_6739 [Wickerhamomyces ciferrii]CCH47128.1 hypothetical protein BN7_6739 [Wickerhamomyces ciferrii]